MTVAAERRVSNAGVSSVSWVAVSSTAATPPASSRWLSVTAVPRGQPDDLVLGARSLVRQRERNAGRRRSAGTAT